MKEALKNIKKNKLTSGASLALLIVLGARLLGLKTNEVAGIPVMDIAQAAIETISAIILLFARDPKQAKPAATPQNK